MKELDIEEARHQLTHTTFSTWIGLLLKTPAELSKMLVSDIGHWEAQCHVAKKQKIVDELRRHGIITLMAGGTEFMLHATGKMRITQHIRRYKTEEETLPASRRSIRR